MLNLVLGAKDMRIVLDKVSDPHQAMTSPGGLVAMTGAELGQLERQIPVALETLIEDLDVAGAVHRLDGEVPTL